VYDEDDVNAGIQSVNTLLCEVVGTATMMEVCVEREMRAVLAGGVSNWWC